MWSTTALASASHLPAQGVGDAALPRGKPDAPLQPADPMVLPQTLDRLAQANARATAGFTTREVTTLHDLLGRVLANLETMIENPDAVAGPSSQAGA